MAINEQLQMQPVRRASSFPWPVILSSATLVGASALAVAAALRSEPIWLAPALALALASLGAGLWNWRRQSRAQARIGLGLTRAAPDSVLADARYRVVQVGPAVAALIAALAPALRERVAGFDGASLLGADVRRLLEALGAQSALDEASWGEKTIDVTAADRFIGVTVTLLSSRTGCSIVCLRASACSSPCRQWARCIPSSCRG